MLVRASVHASVRACVTNISRNLFISFFSGILLRNAGLETEKEAEVYFQEKNLVCSKMDPTWSLSFHKILSLLFAGSNLN